MEYHLSYDYIENNIRNYLIYIVYNKCKNGDINNTSINILCKILNKINNQDIFFYKILSELLIKQSNIKYIDNNYVIFIKNNFIKSIQLLIYHKKYGIYLLKYYYYIFYIIYSYQNAIKYICTKIYHKSKKKKFVYNTNKLLYYNISNINLIIHNFYTKSKFSYNDDNNYQLLNDIILNFLSNIKKNNIIYIHNFQLLQDDRRIFITLFNNINNLYNNIKYI